MNNESSKDCISGILNREYLEKRFLFRSRLSYVFIFIISLIDVFLIIELFIHNIDSKILIYSLLSLGIGVCLHLWPQFQLIFWEKIKLDSFSKEENIGKYSANEINELLCELLSQYVGLEQPTIYLIDELDANAFVVNSQFFNSIKPLNAIYISPNLFDLLEKEEIKAILSHELAHFYRYMYPASKIWLPTAIFLGLTPVYVLVSFKILIDNFFTVWLFIYWILVVVTNKLYFSTDKTLEYLSDVYAAERHGKLNLINALISITKHHEVTEIVLEEALKKIKADKQLSIENIDDIIEILDREVRGKGYTKKELIAIIKSVFRSKKMNSLRKRLGRLKRYFENQSVEESLRLYADKEVIELYNWKNFDFDEEKFKISEKEYPYLIEELMKYPDKQLFHLIHDQDDKVVDLSHPTVRQRILFIEKSLGT